MTIKVTAITVRPDTTVGFFEHDAATKAHLNATFPSVTTNESVSSDGLTKTIAREFPDETVRAAWQSDPIFGASKSARIAHNAQHGFTYSVDIELI